MSRQEKTAEVIRQLKIVREDRGLSLQRILDMVLEAGGNISIGTVRRVFEEGSETRNFRYEDSIKPIADVLLDVQSTTMATGADAAELEALRALVRYKNSYIAELEAAASNVDAKVQAAKDDAQKKIDFLVVQLAGKDEQLKAKDEQLKVKDQQLKVKDQQIQDRGKLLDERRDFIYRKDRTIALLGILLAIFAFLFFAALVVDKMNPNMGFFWLDGIAAQIYNGQLTGAAYGVGL